MPQLIDCDIDNDYLIYEQAEGSSYEPDEFPNNYKVAYQLGQYIGYLHNISFETCGLYPNGGTHDFKKRMISTMEELIKKYWNDNAEVKQYFEKAKEMDIPMDTYSLIMPDISANQFLYSHDLKNIKANVDLDAYVIGPRELELTVIEMCLSDMDPFIKGYEKYLQIPDMNICRKFYRFWMYLNDPWEKNNLYDFIGE